MNLHEYQAKELFRARGLETGEQILAHSPEEAAKAVEKLGGKCVIKAQVLSGGRGKAGGVTLVDSREKARLATEKILALTIGGYRVEKVLVVPAAAIVKEFYAGFAFDRGRKCVTLMLSAQGGMEIEELAEEHPEAIIKVPVYPHKGLDQNALRLAVESCFDSKELVSSALDMLEKMYKMYLELDCTLVEVNPLALLGNGKLMVLDAKVSIDENALYRQAGMEAIRNPEESSQDEKLARAANLSFVSMDGNIGCIVNGAGLAMATLDLVKHFGGEPANFLDVGGSSNPRKVVDAVSIIMGNKKVKALLLNIFGGITRCDDIARGLLEALATVKVEVPLVIRLIGTNDAEGRELLEAAGLSAHTDLDAAVEAVVKASKGAAQ